jgi:hypothetical protein
MTEVPRARSIADLDVMFRAGGVPDPRPEGFLRGRLLTTNISGPLDSFFRGLARLWMPWEGKVFNPEAWTGTNRFTRSVRLPMKALWPFYVPVSEQGDRILAFQFRNRVARGAVDPGLDVLKIDYDFEANPGFIIRRILDELVQVNEGLYLGKVLFRLRGRFHPIAYFSLRR